MSGLNLNWIDFNAGGCEPTAITPYIQIDGGNWLQTTIATVNEGGQIDFGPHPTSEGSWIWTGPDGFTSSIRTPEIINVQTRQAGTYIATYTNSCGAQSTKDFEITVNPVGLPSPWTNGDIGSVGATGSVVYSNGTFTINASGSDIWNTSDEFHFVHQTVSGNKEITARVASVTNTHDWAKAGVMFRDNLNANAKFIMVIQRPDKQISMQWRSSTGGSATSKTITGLASVAKYVKIERDGNTFTGYYSTDGTSFTEIQSVTISLASNAKVGLAATSHNNGTICTAQFDNVIVKDFQNGTGGFELLVQAEDYFEMYGVQTENTSDTGGGLNVGWLDAGDWMGYSINIPSDGAYTIEYRVANESGGGNLTLEQFGGGTVFGSIAIPSTGGWQNWTTVSHTIDLQAGQQNIGISIQNGGWNLNWLRVTSGGLKSGTTSSDKYLFEDSDYEQQMKIYPNPVSERLFIKALEKETLLRIYNLCGAKLHESYGRSIDVSNIPKGVYLLKIGDKDSFKEIKFIKN